MAAGRIPVTAQVEKLAQPIAEQMGLELWDIEFVKEGASWFLRIYIDRESGVTIDDCEAFSRAIDGPLDEADPIDQQYYLEVSSPGIERELKKDRHFSAMIGNEVKIRLIRPMEDGTKEFVGTLSDYEDGVITVASDGGEISVKRSETAHVRLYEPFEL